MHTRLRSLNKLLAEFYGSGILLRRLGTGDPKWKAFQKLAADFIVETNVDEKHRKASEISKHVLGELLLPHYESIPTLGEGLMQFEEQGSPRSTFHRDHHIHTTYVLLLGFYFFFTLNVKLGDRVKAIPDLYYVLNTRLADRQPFDRELKTGNISDPSCWETTPTGMFYPRMIAQFIHAWSLASLGHDLGYPLSDSSDALELDEFVENLEKLIVNLFQMSNDEIKELLGDEVGLFLAFDIFTGSLLKPKSEIGRTYFGESADFRRLMSHRLVRITGEERDWSHHVASHTSWSAFSTKDAEHGSVGAYFVLFIYFLTRFLRADITSEETSQLLDWIFFGDEMDAVAACYVHNAFLDHISVVNLEASPILYLLILCDELQQFGRPLSSASSLTQEQYDNSLNTVEIGFTSQGRLAFRFLANPWELPPDAKERQSKSLQRLEKLKPSLVSSL